MGFPGGAVVKYPLAKAGDTGDVGLIPGSGRSPGVGNGNPLQYSCCLPSSPKIPSIQHLHDSQNEISKVQKLIKTLQCLSIIFWVKFKLLSSHNKYFVTT